MNKFFNTLFIVVYTVTGSMHARTWWDMGSNSSNYDYNDSINFDAIKRIIEQEMDHLFQPYSQTLVNRNYLAEVKEYAKKEISKTIKNSCSTHTKAKKMAIKLTQEFAVDVLVEWAAHIARDLLKNPPVNPSYINKQDIISAVKQIMRSQAQLALLEKDRRLTKLVQNLVENVQVLVDQEIKFALSW